MFVNPWHACFRLVRCKASTVHSGPDLVKATNASAILDILGADGGLAYLQMPLVACMGQTHSQADADIEVRLLKRPLGAYGSSCRILATPGRHRVIHALMPVSR